jgi:hypothetical protein
MEDMDQKQTTDLIVKAPSGARFFRSDLHIHSYSGSHDVRDDKMTPQAIVETAIAEELSIIAITDHNEINNVKLALKASRGKTVHVVPGVELSTSDGHLLVYFADLAPLTDYFGKLEFADRGTERSRCTTSLLECLNRIDTKRGFAVLAHVDGDGGFEERVPGNPPHKGDVITHPALLGIELHSATSKVSYAEDDENPERGLLGRRRVDKLGLGNKQFLARVLFSDSHTLNGLGKNAQGRRRLTRIKMDAPSFDGIMIAFQDADARIRLEDEIPQATPHIVGIKLEGGFLDGQMIRLSENLTCIIGGRGAGKSTAFESVRFIAPRRTEHALVDSEVWPDSMQIVWADKAGQIHSAHRRKFEDITNIEDL